MQFSRLSKNRYVKAVFFAFILSLIVVSVRLLSIFLFTGHWSYFQTWQEYVMLVLKIGLLASVMFILLVRFTPKSLYKNNTSRRTNGEGGKLGSKNKPFSKGLIISFSIWSLAMLYGVVMGYFNKIFSSASAFYEHFVIYLVLFFLLYSGTIVCLFIQKK